MEKIVYVDPRPNLRSREFTVFAGQLFLKRLFDTNDDMTSETEVYLEHPERWLNILEIRVLWDAIEQRCPNMRKVVVLTSSEHLLTVTNREDIKVFQDATKYPEVPYKPGVRYCPLVANCGFQFE